VFFNRLGSSPKFVGTAFSEAWLVSVSRPMALSPRRSAAASETGKHHTDHQGKKDEDASEDLPRHQPVPRKPVAEDGREDAEYPAMVS
jgi:hypothetical protein